MKTRKHILIGLVSSSALVLAGAAAADSAEHDDPMHGYGAVGYVSLAGTEPLTRHDDGMHGYGAVGYSFTSASEQAQASHDPISVSYETMGARFRDMLSYQEIAQKVQAKATQQMLAIPSPKQHESADAVYGYGATGYESLAKTIDRGSHGDELHGYGATGYGESLEAARHDDDMHGYGATGYDADLVDQL